MGLTLGLSVTATVVIAYALKATMGLRPTADAEEMGLDDAEHGEAGYHPDEAGGHGETEQEHGILPNAAKPASAADRASLT